MALEIPTYPNPYDPNTPLPDAYAWLSGIYLDLGGGQGRVTLNINPNENAWTAPPIATITVTLGEVFKLKTATTPQEGMPSLPELMADPDFAAAYATIGTKIYSHLQRHPALVGSRPK